MKGNLPAHQSLPAGHERHQPPCADRHRSGCRGGCPAQRLPERGTTGGQQDCAYHCSAWHDRGVEQCGYSDHGPRGERASATRRPRGREQPDNCGQHRRPGAKERRVCVEARQHPVHPARCRGEHEHRGHCGPLGLGLVSDGSGQPQSAPGQQHKQPDSDGGHLTVHRVREAHPRVAQRRVVDAYGLPAVEPVRPAPPVPPGQRLQPLGCGGVADHVAGGGVPIADHHIPAHEHHRAHRAARGQPHRGQAPPLGAGVLASLPAEFLLTAVSGIAAGAVAGVGRLGVRNARRDCGAARRCGGAGGVVQPGTSAEAGIGRPTERRPGARGWRPRRAAQVGGPAQRHGPLQPTGQLYDRAPRRRQSLRWRVCCGFWVCDRAPRGPVPSQASAVPSAGSLRLSTAAPVRAGAGAGNLRTESRSSTVTALRGAVVF